jgi:hypothetical protein
MIYSPPIREKGRMITRTQHKKVDRIRAMALLVMAAESRFATSLSRLSIPTSSE